LKVLGLCTLAALGAGAGSALARTRVSFTLPGVVNAAVPVSFSYTNSGVRGRSRVVLQRQEGTAHVWRIVEGLRRGGGSATLGGLPLGHYLTRVAVLDARGRVLAQQQRRLAVFGDVSFSTLFSGGGGGQAGVYTTPTGTFPYVLSRYDGAVDYTAFTVTQNPCRSVHLTFVEGTDSVDDPSQQHGTATVVQQSADPVSTTEPGNSPGAVDAALTPGQSWALNVSQAQNEPTSFLFTWYINGSANCDSTALQTS
jgi:hypothetical protein